MTYRADIDGLRAIAVVIVILFHSGFKQFSGGFVGVDVFFVISGYLITTKILLQKEQDTFSLSTFYEHRARRILPALFFVMFASIPLAWQWLLPAAMQDFSQSLVAVSTFSSNILFWQETGYWGVENELKPLLHTWSLAVEEQYYILFPLFLIAIWRFHKRFILSSFVVIAVASLSISQWGALHNPTANFFLLTARIWELLIGAIIAFYRLYQKRNAPLISFAQQIDQIMSLIGLALIGYSTYTFNETIPFPSFLALLPTVGTGFIILFSSTHTIVYKLLSTKILVSLGLISYSAYLWHQPLFAFARHRSLVEPQPIVFIFLALISFPLAYFSWRYVEQPFRQKDKFTRRTVVIFSVTGSLFFIAIGLAGHVTDGFNGILFRKQLTESAIKQQWLVNHGLSPTCQGTFTLSPDCRTSSEPVIVVWGDSYAMHLVQGILASNPDAQIIQMTKSVCGPFFDISPITPIHPKSWAEGCLEFTEQVRQWIQTSTTVKYVVISSAFAQYLDDENILLSRTGEFIATDTDIVAEELIKTVTELQSMGVTPVIFSPTPTNGTNLGTCLAKASWNNLDLDRCNFKLSQITSKNRESYRMLEIIQDHYRVLRLDQLICENQLCKTHLDDIFLYQDIGHLSAEGSSTLGSQYDWYTWIVEEE